MMSWLVRRREVTRQTEADATALIAERGAGGYTEARRRQQDAIMSKTARAGVARQSRSRSEPVSGSDSTRPRGWPWTLT